MTFLMPGDLEFPNVKDTMYPFEARGEYLALCGDIGHVTKPDYVNFLIEQAQRFKKVFVVAGNHEHFKLRYGECKQKMEEVCSEHPNLVFMNKHAEIVEVTNPNNNKTQGYRIIGCTLWSYIPQEVEHQLTDIMNDYKLIYQDIPDKLERITVSQTNAWHKEEVEWISQQIKEAKQAKQKVIVLTHHVPSLRISATDYGYGTSLEYLLGDPVVLWCFGHTHYSCQNNIKGTLVCSNQQGYIMMGEKTGFHSEYVIEVCENECKVVHDDVALKKKKEQEKQMLDQMTANAVAPPPMPPPPPPQ